MKKNKKIIALTLLIFILISCFLQVFAATTDAYQAQDAKSSSTTTASQSKLSNQLVSTIYGTSGNSKLFSAGGSILGIIQVIGYFAAVIMLVIIGIKFVMASPEGKADLKKQLIPYVIGCIILIAGSTFITIIKAWTYASVL